MEILTVVAVYFMYWAMYPITFIGEAIVTPQWSVTGLVITLLLYRFARRVLPIWTALWLMPGTIICGAAAVVPLPIAALAASKPGACSSPTALAVCALLNLLLVYAFRATYRHLRRRHANNVA